MGGKAVSVPVLLQSHQSEGDSLYFATVSLASDKHILAAYLEVFHNTLSLCMHAGKSTEMLHKIAGTT